MHPPKVEYFDIVERTNTDPKGFIRPVEQYRVEPWGLYMARHSDHPTFHYLESWLIPSLAVRVSVFHNTPTHDRDHDFYVDIGEFTAGPNQWKAVDHYLDLVVRSGRDIRLLDIDELLEAQVAGLISPAAAHLAIERAVAAVDGIASHDYQVDVWLASLGMTISWL